MKTEPDQRQDAIGRLKPDLIAGMTAAAVVLPKAMAYATVAGQPVAAGLYTAFVPMVVYALLGTSRVLSVSSTATLAILTSTQLALVVPDGDPNKMAIAAATLAAMTGVLLTLASALRLRPHTSVSSAPPPTSYQFQFLRVSKRESAWSSSSIKCPSCSASTSQNRTSFEIL